MLKPKPKIMSQSHTQLSSKKKEKEKEPTNITKPSKFAPPPSLDNFLATHNLEREADIINESADLNTLGSMLLNQLKRILPNNQYFYEL